MKYYFIINVSNIFLNDLMPDIKNLNQIISNKYVYDETIKGKYIKFNNIAKNEHISFLINRIIDKTKKRNIDEYISFLLFHSLDLNIGISFNQMKFINKYYEIKFTSHNLTELNIQYFVQFKYIQQIISIVKKYSKLQINELNIEVSKIDKFTNNLENDLLEIFSNNPEYYEKYDKFLYNLNSFNTFSYLTNLSAFKNA